ncbi:hypothetical protein CGCA056_v006427 [Colletotrichum aenigma]|uniref:uncharacterized protein n=1 Tax=Colletotrichum aenigma TaxID=1215731 RepID=UPI0018733900|nr:uncharacterized protein CGCA056_v006427 [Colletotrichum aenigma]KAF5522354.1 hypothetical protein CGCA056_v006427 [Colletotrichum aenigma]
MHRLHHNHSPGPRPTRPRRHQRRLHRPLRPRVHHPARRAGPRGDLQRPALRSLERAPVHRHRAGGSAGGGCDAGSRGRRGVSWPCGPGDRGG